MINRIVDLVVKDIRVQCASHRICTNKCPYTLFCEKYYSDEYIDSFSDEDVADAVKKCIKADIKIILKECIKDDFKRLLKEVL